MGSRGHKHAGTILFVLTTCSSKDVSEESDRSQRGRGPRLHQPFVALRCDCAIMRKKRHKERMKNHCSGVVTEILCWNCFSSSPSSPKTGNENFAGREGDGPSKKLQTKPTRTIRNRCSMKEGVYRIYGRTYFNLKFYSQSRFQINLTLLFLVGRALLRYSSHYRTKSVEICAQRQIPPITCDHVESEMSFTSVGISDIVTKVRPSLAHVALSALVFVHCSYKSAVWCTVVYCMNRKYHGSR